MIVKNEEKYLGRCLEAITPILREVSSELIIADTGSTDRTVEIARQFTDKVFHFEWCNDFSAARNSTLEKATGEWYLYLDADEIVEDCTEIIRFFNTGEYLKYESATLKIKSFNNESQNITTMVISRFVRRTEDLRFVNTIHERPSRVENPMKNLDVTVNHYGYVTQDNEERIQKKVEQNLEIMLNEEKSNPEEVYNLHNICQAYLLVKDYKAALAYCDKGLKYSKEQKRLPYFIFLVRKAQIYSHMLDYEKTLIATIEYFRSKKKVLVSDIEMYIYQANSYMHFGGGNEAIESYVNYIQTYQAYQSGRLRTPDVNLHSINYTETRFYNAAALQLVDLCLKIGDFDKARKYCNYLKITEIHEDRDLLNKKIKQEIEIMRRLLDFSALPQLYRDVPLENQPELQTQLESALYAMAQEHREGERQVEYVRCLRSLIKLEPSLGGLIQTLIEEMNEKNQSPAEQELLKYARIVKGNIKALCEQNDTQKALSLIASYEQLCPGDAEIADLKQQLLKSGR
jgi:glycosyltransferase involved in cell wall biosynthesis